MATSAAVLQKYQSMLKPSGGAELTDSLILIMGPPGAGKTTLAVTASDFMPDKLPAEKFTSLEDVVVIACDEGATDGLASLGLGCKVIDFNAIYRDVQHPAQTMEICFDLAKQSGANKFVWDTISKFDMVLNAWLNLPAQAEIANADKFTLFRYILGTHQVLMAKYRELKGLRLGIFHAKAMVDDITKDKDLKDKQERQDKAQGAAGLASLVLDVTGRARDLWTRDASLILAARQYQPINSSKLVREVLTQFDPGVDMIAKSRFEARLPAKIEPNLRKAIQLIRGC